MRRIRLALQDVNVKEGFHAGVPRHLVRRSNGGGSSQRGPVIDFDNEVFMLACRGVIRSVARLHEFANAH